MKAVDQSRLCRSIARKESCSELLEETWSQLRGRGSNRGRERLLLETFHALGTAGANIRQNAVGSLAVFLTIAITIFLSGAFLLTVQPVISFILEDAQQIPLRITLAEGVERGAATELQVELSAFEDISEVHFVSGEEALENLQQRLGEDHPLFQEEFAGVGEVSSVELSGKENEGLRLLPDRLLVLASPQSDKEALQNELREHLGGDPRVEGVALQSQVAQQLFHLARLFSRIGVFSLISLVVDGLRYIVPQ